MTSHQGYLLDTNILSEIRKKRPESKVLDFLDSLEEDQIFISAMTIAEITKGIHLTSLHDEDKAFLLRHWLETKLMPEYKDSVLPFDTLAAQAWGLLMGTEKNRRQPPSPQDSIIAATAYAHRLTLVTRNKPDFQAFPINVLNPWEWQATK